MRVCSVLLCKYQSTEKYRPRLDCTRKENAADQRRRKEKRARKSFLRGVEKEKVEAEPDKKEIVKRAQIIRNNASNR